MLNERDKRKLLIPGWAGELNAEELAYIKGRLFSDRRLRAYWGFKRGMGRLSEEKIRIVAMDSVHDLKNAPDLALAGSL